MGLHADSSIRENARRERGLCLAGFQKRIWLSEKQLLNLRCHRISMVQATESRKGLNLPFSCFLSPSPGVGTVGPNGSGSGAKPRSSHMTDRNHDLAACQLNGESSRAIQKDSSQTDRLVRRNVPSRRACQKALILNNLPEADSNPGVAGKLHLQLRAKPQCMTPVSRRRVSRNWPL